MLNLKAEGSDLYTSNVEAMIDAGWELAAHTIHHLDLTDLGAAELKEEVAGSRAILRREYGVPVKDFCYPGRPVRRNGDRRRQGRRLHRRDDRDPRLRRTAKPPTNSPASRSSAPAASPAWPKTCGCGLEPDRDAVGGEPLLGLADAVGAVVEDRGAEHRVGAARRRSPR